MNLKKLSVILLGSVITVSCVSKKKYVELENQYNDTRSELVKTKVEQEELQRQVEQIQLRVERYNNKIAALSTMNTALNDNLLVSEANGDLMLSENNKRTMRSTLKNVPQEKLASAKTLKDSLNLAISYNMMQQINGTKTGKNIDASIEESVVMINIEDNLLFKDSSYRIGNEADDILAKIAEVAIAEPSIEILVEGHTDDRTVKKGSYVKDNWELSAERSAAIVRRLQEKFGVSPDQLIIAGRASYDPLVNNNSDENRARNRRTKIVIMPNLDKFFAMLASENDTAEITKEMK